MKFFLSFLIAVTLLPRGAHAQKASVKIRLIDSSAVAASDYVFELKVKNDSFSKYWVEDTNTMKKDIMGGSSNELFYVQLEKKGKNDFQTYEKIRVRSGDRVPERDSCELNCCNCEILETRQSVKVNLQLIKNYILEKGHYRVWVNIHPPEKVCAGCEQLKHIYGYRDFWVR